MMSHHSFALSNDTRLRILRAAAVTFAARGFRAATMKQIAVEARVNDVTVYRHFPRKQQLYWAAIDWKINSSSLNDVVSECLLAGGPPRSLLRELGERILDVLLSDPSLGRLIYFAVLELPEEKKKLYEGHFRPMLNAFRTVIESWVRSGEIRNVDAHSAALAIVGMIWSPYNLREIFGVEIHSSQTVKQLAEDFAELCVQGLKARAPQAVSE